MWGEVFGGLAIKPIIMPETSLGSITNHDRGRGFKEEAVILIAGEFKACPWFGFIGPVLPKPPKA